MDCGERMREEIFAESPGRRPHHQRSDRGAPQPHPPPRQILPGPPLILFLCEVARQGPMGRRMAGGKGRGQIGRRASTGSAGPMRRARRGWCFACQAGRTGRPCLLRDVSWVDRRSGPCPAPPALAPFFASLDSPLINPPIFGLGVLCCAPLPLTFACLCSAASGRGSFLKPKPNTIKPKLQPINPEPSDLNFQPSTLYPKP